MDKIWACQRDESNQFEEEEPERDENQGERRPGWPWAAMTCQFKTGKPEALKQFPSGSLNFSVSVPCVVPLKEPSQEGCVMACMDTFATTTVNEKENSPSLRGSITCLWFRSTLPAELSALWDDSYPLGAPRQKAGKVLCAVLHPRFGSHGNRGRHEHGWEHLQLARLLCQGYL